MNVPKCNNNGGTAKSIKSRQKSSADKCLLKVHGIGETPFLMELVPYDTIKTVRNLLTNVLKNEYIKQNREASNSTTAAEDAFILFTGFPRHVLNDDSKSLGDLGLVPNGVLHLVRNTTVK